MTIPQFRHWAVLSLAAMLASVVILFGIRSLSGSESPMPTDLSPEVTCDPTGCDIRIVARVADRRIRSAPLAFRAQSAEIESISGHALFGYVLPGHAPRALTAWSIGREDHGIGVAVDVVDTGVDGHAVLVYQFAGLDHIKRAHAVLIVGSEELVAIAERVDGAGPHSNSMAPVDGGIGMRHVDPDGSITTETFRWSRGDHGPELVASD